MRFALNRSIQEFKDPNSKSQPEGHPTLENRSSNQSITPASSNESKESHPVTEGASFFQKKNRNAEENTGKESSHFFTIPRQRRNSTIPFLGGSDQSQEKEDLLRRIRELEEEEKMVVDIKKNLTESFQTQFEKDREEKLTQAKRIESLQQNVIQLESEVTKLRDLNLSYERKERVFFKSRSKLIVCRISTSRS